MPSQQKCWHGRKCSEGIADDRPRPHCCEHRRPRRGRAARAVAGDGDRRPRQPGAAQPGGLKVGGHQASSASMVTIMTALWFRQLRAEDRVSVKPHASPVLHAINYLLGELDAAYLTTLREFGGLQSYPSRPRTRTRPTTRPARSASARPRRSGARSPAGTWTRRFGAVPAAGRQYSLVGDAELDEGACLGGVLDPMVAELGEVVWVVDLNRQSLDRVVPTMGADPAAGHVRRGRLAGAHRQVRAAAARSCSPGPGGAALRDRIDEMSNPEYQRLLRARPGRAARAAARRRTRRRGHRRAGRRRSTTPTCARDPQPRRPRPRRAARRVRGRSTTPGRPSSSPTRSRATGWPPRATRRTTPRC